MRRAYATQEQFDGLVEKIMKKGRLVKWSHDSEDDLTYLSINCGGFCASIRSDGWIVFTIGGQYEEENVYRFRWASTERVDLCAYQIPHEVRKETATKILNKFMPNGWGKVQADEVAKKLASIGVVGKSKEPERPELKGGGVRRETSIPSPLERDAMRVARIVVGALILWALIWVAL